MWKSGEPAGAGIITSNAEIGTRSYSSTAISIDLIAGCAIVLVGIKRFMVAIMLVCSISIFVGNVYDLQIKRCGSPTAL